jgi:hypothetical protein
MASPVIDPAVTLDFATMTIAQLLAEAQRIATVVELANNQREDILARIAKRKAKVVAQMKIDQLSALEKDALLAVLTSP